MNAEQAIRSWLYVPGDRPDRFEKAAASGADAVVVDLEDAVAQSHKQYARDAVTRWLNSDRAPSRIVVRINVIDGGGLDDLAAVAGPGLFGVRIPKVDGPDQIRRAASFLDGVNCPARLFPMLENCRALEAVTAIATADSRVGGLLLGEADLALDLGIDSADALNWARVRVVVAARAAGLPNPPQSVYPRPYDIAGLLADSRRGREQGHFGRSAVHPAQIETIHAVYAPGEEQLRRARTVLDAFERAHAAGVGTSISEDGQFIDAAAAAQARAVVERADERLP